MNEPFIKILEELEDIMSRQGEPFKARAYQKAAEVIITHPENITTLEQLKGKPAMGKTIMSTLQEYMETGSVQTIEKYKHHPLNTLTRVFGIGPKKAQDFINEGLDTIDKLKAHPEKLTAAQKVGVEFYDDIEKKIPREEIDQYKQLLADMTGIPSGTTFEIVGSYRRGASMSGDIDIIITNTHNNLLSFETMLNALIKQNIITHVLSRGRSKSLTLARLQGKPARRIDLLYSPPEEYAFAILYFTGSKAFNTMQRQKAVELGYTLNEHGLHYFHNGVKGEKVEGQFHSEKDIFDFLGMEYREPRERKDGRVIVSNEPLLENLNKIKTHGVEWLTRLTEPDIETIIQHANKTYYGDETPIMTDDLYDMVCDYVCEKFPNNPIAKVGHTQLEPLKHKATLPFELWSMDKIKPDSNALNKWTARYKGPYVLSCKLDGVSGLYVSPDKLYTRGNGKIGQDISHMIPYLRLPKKEGLVVRGEIIIPKEVFTHKYSKDFSNPRNFVAGVVNQKKGVMERVKDLDFVAYEVIRPALNPSQQLKSLHAQTEMEVVSYVLQKSVSVESLSDLLLTWRNTCKYELDGIICSNDEVYARSAGNPEHAFAFKMVHKDQTAETKVVDVKWNVSKDGYLKPRVQIEPVMIGGAKIEYTTGFNAKFIVDNHIGTGAVISLIRSGDVIPHIQHVIRGAETPLMPTSTYKWNDTLVDILLDDHKADREVNQKIITLFFKTIGVDGLGAGNIKKIIDAGHTTIQDILCMSLENFMEIDGFKEKLSDKIYEGIKEKFKEASLPVLMEATNIFGRGFGKKKFQLILTAVPDIMVSNISYAEKINTVSKIDGMAKTTSEKFIDKLAEFKEWAFNVGLKREKLIFTPDFKSDTNNVLHGKRIVLTGFRDKVFIEKLEQRGAILSGVVSKKTDLVIVKDQHQETSKTQDANTHGIQIIPYQEFINAHNIV